MTEPIYDDLRNYFIRHGNMAAIGQLNAFVLDQDWKPKEYDPPLDEGIAPAVRLLNAAGIETFESCEGGPGHAYPEPTVRFNGGRAEGFKALAVVQAHALPVCALRRVWTINDGEPTGPYWELVFWRKLDNTDGRD